MVKTQHQLSLAGLVFVAILCSVTQVQASDFADQKGNLVCPLKDGTIDLKTIYLSSDRKLTEGLDLISQSEQAMVSYDGVVVTAYGTEEEGMAVIVSHGDHFTVYSNLSSVLVARGDTLKEGDKLGVAKKDEDGEYRLHFEIWAGTDKLWPADWLSCRKESEEP